MRRVQIGDTVRYRLGTEDGVGIRDTGLRAKVIAARGVVTEVYHHHFSGLCVKVKGLERSAWGPELPEVSAHSMEALEIVA